MAPIKMKSKTIIYINILIQTLISVLENLDACLIEMNAEFQNSEAKMN